MVAVSRGVDADAQGLHVEIINAGGCRGIGFLLLLSIGRLFLSDRHQEDLEKRSDWRVARREIPPRAFGPTMLVIMRSVPQHVPVVS